MIGYALTSHGSAVSEGAPTWREGAITAHRRIERERALALRADLAARVRTLTGSAVAPDTVYLNRETGVATVAVDGARFRLSGGALVLLRPCAHCGTGQFASAPIEDCADLGGALADWTPLHEECQPEDSAEGL
jgi:hypothetical protein